MGREFWTGLWPAASWLGLPLVAAALAGSCYKVTNLSGHDPRAWGLADFAIFLGPLLGYGFLAGATSVAPDGIARRGPAAWFGRRGFWFAVGPWLGFLFWLTVFFLLERLEQVVALPELTGANRSLSAAVVVFVLATIGYGWVMVAWFPLRRARRQRRLGAALKRGIIVGLGFVGSLLGTFWGITSAWRAFFFDTTVAKTLLVVGLATLALSGCGAVTVGDVRRRELFDALMLAWVVGLAVVWRWLSRSPKGSG